MLKFKKEVLKAGLCVAVLFSVSGQSINAQSLFSTDDNRKSKGTFLNSTRAENLIMSTRRPELALEPEVAQQTLIAFDQPKSDFMLTGENDVAQFTFQHDLQKAGAVGSLVIAYKNAVSVMPESSLLSVKVNGYPIGNITIFSSSTFAEHKFSVPANALVDGENIVEMRAVHRHRVDCSLEATYELWTEIDFMNSGFLTESEYSLTNFSALKMIGRGENGLTDLRLDKGKSSI